MPCLFSYSKERLQMYSGLFKSTTPLISLFILTLMTTWKKSHFYLWNFTISGVKVESLWRYSLKHYQTGNKNIVGPMEKPQAPAQPNPQEILENLKKGANKDQRGPWRIFIYQQGTQIFEKQARKSVYCGSYDSLFSHDQDKKSS